jgi:WD40 repeat protein
LKPSNIMINQGNEPVVMDFGLARQFNKEETRLTGIGALIGTPAYMPPEQVNGDDENLGPGCDIYSLGVILYELLTGQLPFRGRGVLAQILTEEPERPSLRLRPDLDPRLEAICLKAMAKKVPDRYATMADLAAELTDCLRQEPKVSQPQPSPLVPESVAETPPSPVPSWRSWVRGAGGRERVSFWGYVAAAAAIPVLLLGGVILYLNTGEGTVKIEVDDPIAVVHVDGKVIHIEKLGEPITVSTGKHQLVVKRGDLEVHTQQFSIRRGDNLVLRAELQAKAAAEAADKPVPRPQQGPERQAAALRVQDAPTPRDTKGLPLVLDLDFSDPKADLRFFNVQDGPDLKVDVKGDEHQILAKTAGGWWSGPGEQLGPMANYVCEVEGRLAERAEGAWGLSFGYVLGYHFAFEVREGLRGGQIGLLYFGPRKEIVPWKDTPTLRPITQLNTVRLEVTGTKMRLFANGQHVVDQVDNRLLPGFVLLSMYADKAPVDAHFRRLRIWRVEPPGTAPHHTRKAPLYEADFHKPVAEFPEAKDGSWGYERGSYFIKAGKGAAQGAGSCPGKPISDFYAEVTGRVAEGAGGSWALVCGAGRQVGTRIEIRADGHYRVRHLSDGQPRLLASTLDWRRHDSLGLNGAFTTLGVAVRDRVLSLYFDGQWAGDVLDPGYAPGFLHLAAVAGEEPVRTEFQGIRLWPVEPTSTGLPEPQARTLCPADALRRDQIPPYELKVAGRGDPKRAPPELVAILGNSRMQHWNGVAAVAFSPDRKTLATGSRDRTVTIWDIASGDQIHSLEGHSDEITAVAFSPDGRTLASASADTTVKLWETATGNPVRTLYPRCYVHHVVFSPDGKRLAAGLSDHTARIWDAATGEQRHSLDGHKGGVHSVAFSPKDAVLATGSRDGTIKIWNVATGKSLPSPAEGHEGGVFAVAFSPDGSRLASGGRDGFRKLWDVATWKVIDPRGGHDEGGFDDGAKKVVFSPDGKLLVSTSYWGTVWLCDAATGREQRRLPRLNWLFALAISPDSRTLAIGNWDSAVRLWDVNADEPRPVPADTVASFDCFLSRCMSISPDGRTLVSGGPDGKPRIWDMATGKVRRILPKRADVVSAFGQDGQTLVSGSEEGIMLWDVATGSLRHNFDGRHTDRVNGMAISPNGENLASASDDKTVKLWKVATGKEIRTLQMHDGSVWRVAYSPDGKTLVLGGGDGTIRLLDNDDRKERPLGKHDDGITSLAFSPEGKLLASASQDGTVKLWDLSTGESRHTLKHPPLVESVAFSPDGMTVATAGVDGKVRLWSPRTGLEQQTLELGPPGGHIWKVAFTPEGRHLVTANRNGTIYVLRLAEAGGPSPKKETP